MRYDQYATTKNQKTYSMRWFTDIDCDESEGLALNNETGACVEFTLHKVRKGKRRLVREIMAGDVVFLDGRYECLDEG